MEIDWQMVGMSSDISRDEQINVIEGDSSKIQQEYICIGKAYDNIESVKGNEK